MELPLGRQFELGRREIGGEQASDDQPDGRYAEERQPGDTGLAGDPWADGDNLSHANAARRRSSCRGDQEVRSNSMIQSGQ
jgi:hypothetical protein